ncbi:MAG: T9SS type A sorting domain-containing protein [candidate division Zixibacteria bacterium]|nr:T9SS type A sorting domain-containing protein [candidate division Zixibacteria bacterium]
MLKTKFERFQEILPGTVSPKIFKGLLIGAILAVLLSLSPLNLHAHLLIESPNTGDSFEAGTVIPIEFRVSIPHGIRWWKIWYSVHGQNGPWIQIDSIPPGDTTFWSLHVYNWEIPDSISDSVRILILQRNYNYFDHYDMNSGNFSITPRLQTNVTEESDAALPDGFGLSQNWPNPFNPETSIRFEIPKRSPVELTIYNLNGQKVRALVQSELAAGSHTVVWDGKSADGCSLSSGVYLYRLRYEAVSLTRKMILLK